VPGEYLMESMPPMIFENMGEEEIARIFRECENIHESIYRTDHFFPEIPAEQAGIYMAGGLPVLFVRYSPFAYHPVRRELRLTEEIQVRIEYSRISTNKAVRELHTIHGRRLQEMIYPDMPAELRIQYDADLQIQDEPKVLWFIGPESVREAVTAYALWKSCFGWDVSYFSLEEIESEWAGPDRIDNIRRFLTDHGHVFSPQYLMLIGSVTDIPMKKVYPDPGNHSESGAVLTDACLASPGIAWDADQDGFAGEANEDIQGYIPDIHVGRIPWSDAGTVTAILDRIMSYEKDQGMWKKRGLLAGAINNFGDENYSSVMSLTTDGAALMDQLKHHVFGESESVLLAETQGVETTVYDSDMALNRTNLWTEWSSGNYGCITWWTHGDYRCITRKWWHLDNGNGIPEALEMRKEELLSSNGHPVPLHHHAVIFANSCETGWPEKTSLGRVLIRDGSAGIISPSRTTWYTLGWDELSDGGNASLAYLFWDEYIQKSMNLGDALDRAKTGYLSQFACAWQNMQNVYALNLYGDPTIAAGQAEPAFGALKGEVIFEQPEILSDNSLVAELSPLSVFRVVDEEGHFSYPGLQEGEYVIRIYKNDSEICRQSVSVHAGEVITAVLLVRDDRVPRIILPEVPVIADVHEGFTTSGFINVENAGDDDLRFYCTYDRDMFLWLSLDSSEQVVGPASKTRIEISLSSLHFDQGLKKAVIRVNSNDPENQSMSLPVYMNVIDTIPPAPIEDLEYEEVSEDSIILTWSAPGDNENTGQADAYEIHTGSYDALKGLSGGTRVVQQSIIPGVAGKRESLVISKLLLEQNEMIRIRTLDETGLYSMSNPVFIGTATGSDSPVHTQPEFFILQNYPNPFNAYTRISFSIPVTGTVRLSIFNEMGQCVRDLVNTSLRTGLHQAEWDGRDDRGNMVSSGIYFYAIDAPEGNHVIRKMTFTK